MQPAQFACVVFQCIGGFRRVHRCVLDAFGREQPASLQGGQEGAPIGQAVGVREEPEPAGYVRDRVEARFAQLLRRGERNEFPRRGRQLDQRADRAGRVPVDEGDRHSDSIDGVPGAYITVRDDLSARGARGSKRN
jgi:hypothetical protein